MANIEEKTETDEWEFEETTIADCIAEKITPAQFYPIEGFRINMKWTQIIALVNRKSKTDKRIDTQYSAMKLMNLYSKLMGNKAFL